MITWMSPAWLSMAWRVDFISVVTSQYKLSSLIIIGKVDMACCIFACDKAYATQYVDGSTISFFQEEQGMVIQICEICTIIMLD